MPEASPRYEILTRIASGGMATVYLGRRHGIGSFSRLVAIKKPHSFVTANAKLRKRFEREAQVASLLHHPNVVAVLDVTESDGEAMLVMEYVDGCTLKELMDHVQATGERSDRVMVRVLLDVAAGLQAVHCLRDGNGKELGVVHRDVSPQNVLVGRDGIARLADFGVAKLVGLEHEPTVSDGVSGKLAYLAPEYLSAKHFDAQSDLFSLGVVAWEALAGRRLFKGATPVETILLVTTMCPAQLSEFRPELRLFDGVLGLALERRAEQRPASVACFASALEDAARSIDCLAAPAEVSALVERVAKDAIAERQRALRSVGTERLDPRTSSERDEVVTETLLSGAYRSVPPPKRQFDRRRVALLAAVCLGVAALGALLRRSEHAPSTRPVLGREAAVLTPAMAVRQAPPEDAASALSTKLAPTPDLGAPARAEARSKPSLRLVPKPAPARDTPRASSVPPPTPAPFPERAPPNPYGH